MTLTETFLMSILSTGNISLFVRLFSEATTDRNSKKESTSTFGNFQIKYFIVTLVYLLPFFPIFFFASTVFLGSFFSYRLRLSFSFPYSHGFCASFIFQDQGVLRTALNQIKHFIFGKEKCLRKQTTHF